MIPARNRHTRILGVDPGVVTTGYGVIEKREDRLVLLKAGAVRTSSKDGLPVRLEAIYLGLEGIIREYHPEVLVIEKLYSHYKHPETAIIMGHARGAVCLLCGLHKLKLVNIPSTMIKKSVVGYGRASKLQVQRMVQGFLNLNKPPEPVDVSDALAVALTYAHSLKR